MICSNNVGLNIFMKLPFSLQRSKAYTKLHSRLTFWSTEVVRNDRPHAAQPSIAFYWAPRAQNWDAETGDACSYDALLAATDEENVPKHDRGSTSEELIYSKSSNFV